MRHGKPLSEVLAERLKGSVCSMNVGDDLFLGGFVGQGIQGVTLGVTGSGDPTLQQGVGPMGRTFHFNITPPTAQTAAYAALQAPTNGVALTLAAGAGITKTVAPDGSGATVYLNDLCTLGPPPVYIGRCVSLTSVSNLSGITFTLVGYDIYGRKTTATLAGPNNNTVNFKKAVASVVSITPNATNAGTVSAGTADVFGFPYLVKNGSYVQDIGWNATTGGSTGANGQNNFALDTGTLTSGDQTSPATAATGDPRGTYAPSGASNGTTQLIAALHLDASQCGPNALLTSAIGVTPA